MTSTTPRSPRLTFSRLMAGDLDGFHALLVDPHIRRFLLDDAIVSKAWARAAIEESDRLFERRGVGLWLLHVAEADGPVGFAGFRHFESLGPEPQILYALKAAHAGRGLATEAVAALIVAARAHASFEEVEAAVDAPNLASIRVLEKLGFEEVGTGEEGGWPETRRFRLRADRPVQADVLGGGREDREST